MSEKRSAQLAGLPSVILCYLLRSPTFQRVFRNISEGTAAFHTSGGPFFFTLVWVQSSPQRHFSGYTSVEPTQKIRRNPTIPERFLDKFPGFPICGKTLRSTYFVVFLIKKILRVLRIGISVFVNKKLRAVLDYVPHFKNLQHLKSIKHLPYYLQNYY